MQDDPPTRGGSGEGERWLPPEPAGPAPEPAGQPPPAQPPARPPAQPAPQAQAPAPGDAPTPDAPPVEPIPPAGFPPSPQAPHGLGPAGWPGPSAEAGNGSAVAALVLGIVSLALLLVTFGLSTIVSLGCAVPAIFLGRKGKRSVDAGETRKHRGLAQAGFVMGIVGTILAALATVFWVLVIVLSEDFQREFEREFDDGLDQSLEQSSLTSLALRLAPAVARLALG